MDREVRRTHTCCKNCVFAMYVGNTQVGCELGRTRKFMDQGFLLEARDDEKEFFLVNGRNCRAYRNKIWGENVTKPERPKRVREEMAVRVDALVIIPSGLNFAALERTIRSLKSQTLRPNQVVFVSNQDAVPREQLIVFLRQNCGDLNWKLTHIFLRKEDGSFMSKEEAVDIAFPGVTGEYYVTASAGSVFPEGFIREIDVAINDHLERFSLLTPTPQGEFQVVLTAMHALPEIDGNRPIVRIEDGVETTMSDLNAKADHFVGGLGLVKKVGDVCPSLTLE